MARNDEPDSGLSFASQLETLRSAAKWLVASAAAVGAILVAGLQLTGIGTLPLTSWRFYVAVAAALGTLAGIGYVIKVSSTFLIQEWLTLADFIDEASGLLRPGDRKTPVDGYIKLIESQVMASRHELFAYAAADLPDLHRKLQHAHETLWRADPDSQEYRDASVTSGQLRRAAQAVVHAANYYYARELFRELRVRTAWSALVTAFAIGVFAYVANPPPAPIPPMDVRIIASRPAAP